MKAIDVLPHIHQIDLGIVNVFLLELSSGLLLIDCGPLGSLNKLFEQIRLLGKDPMMIRHIVITHAHYDHSGNLYALKEATNAKTYMHPLGAQLLNDGLAHQSKYRFLNQLIRISRYKKWLRLPYIHVKASSIDYQVKNGEMIPDEHGLQIVYAPGHADDQIALLYPPQGGLLFAADMAENLNTLKLSGQNKDRSLSLQTLQLIAGLHFQKAVFGHGYPIMDNASAYFKHTFGYIAGY